MSLFDDDPLDSLAYSDSDEDEPEPAAPAAAEAPAAPSMFDDDPLAELGMDAAAPAEEGVPPASMLDDDPLADLGMDVNGEDTMGSRMKGLGGSFSGGLRGRTNSDAAQRMLGKYHTQSAVACATYLAFPVAELANCLC